MKIAYLTSQYPAPSHTFIRREVDALRRQGFEIHTFSVRSPRPEERRGEPDEREYAATWYALPARPLRLLKSHLATIFRRPRGYIRTLALALRHRVPGAHSLLWSVFHFSEAVDLAGELERRGIRHVHNHFANSAANVGHLATTLLGCTWSLTLHGISEFDYPAGPLLAAKIRAARHVACVSHFGRAQAMRMVEPKEWDKLFIVRCGVETATLGRTPRDAGRFRFLCVARLTPEKGLAGLLEAMELVLRRRSDIELRIAGDGPEGPALWRRIAERKLSAHVTLLGRLTEDEVLREMAEADCVVSSSLMEGLPVVLMEALGTGIPVIAPRVAGIPELVEQGVNGWLFTPGLWPELADALELAAMDPERCQRLGRAGKARVLEEFEIDHAVVPLAERFASVGGRPALRTPPGPGSGPRSLRAPAARAEHVRAPGMQSGP